MPFTFNAVELCVATINEKPWTRAKGVCKALEYQKGRARNVLKKHVSIKNKQHKHGWKGAPQWRTPLDGLKTVNLTITISVKKECVSCYFQVNNQRQKNLGSIVVT